MSHLSAGDAMKGLRARYAARKKALATAPRPPNELDARIARIRAAEAHVEATEPAGAKPGPAWAHGPPGHDPEAEPAEREPGAEG